MLIRSIYKIAFALASAVFLRRAITAAQPAAIPDLAASPRSCRPFWNGNHFHQSLRKRYGAIARRPGDFLHFAVSPGCIQHDHVYAKDQVGGMVSPGSSFSFSGQFSDMEPAFASDGRELFFRIESSNAGELSKRF